jgi:hypothetical protein
MKQHKPRYDEECLGFLDQKEQAKVRWLQDPGQRNVDNLKNVRHAGSRHFMNKRNEYLKAKINLKLTLRSKISETCIGAPMTLRRITDIVKDEKGDLVTDCHSILAGWRNRFSQLLNVYVLDVVRQREIHTAERLVPEPSAFEFEMAIEKHPPPQKKDTNHYALIKFQQNGLKQEAVLRSEIHKLINSIWNKEELPEELKDCTYL